MENRYGGYFHNFYNIGDIEEIPKYNLFIGGRGNNMNRKVKVVEKPEIVVHGTIERPYFEIKYKEVGKDYYNIGYSSFYLDNVFKWLEEEFEIIWEKEEKKMDKESLGRNEMEERISFTCDICSNCENRKECKHVYQISNCMLLYHKLKERGLVEQSELSDSYTLYKEKEKINQFPVDMNEMQRNILVSLLNTRKECTDRNLLTAHGCVAIIDALFYLVKSLNLPLK